MHRFALMGGAAAIVMLCGSAFAQTQSPTFGAPLTDPIWQACAGLADQQYPQGRSDPWYAFMTRCQACKVPANATEAQTKAALAKCMGSR